jgi:small subunit ribosomal protein S20
LAHSSRTWTGARTPQALKRVRQSHRRNAILQPRRTAAKTQVKNALTIADGGDVEATRKAVAEAASALDRAAKTGAIHPNNAARRKSRLMRRANAALGGESLTATRKPQRQVSKAAAAKAAKVRIAAGKASKAKGEQTAAGKARAALSKSTSAKKTTTKATTAKKPAAKKTPSTSWTKAQLYEEATRLKVNGRSSMSKQQLLNAVRKAR